ncbi:ENDOU [Mytilus coruscus]|uniref:ENDOU n=1 Tax=Mytilus coruscus TaxID=42192 RepID=A0A6J8AT71_MYTCO|nr:ENDOU [Mytilus coruscus]
MKFEYFILIPLVSISVKGANESCLDSCGLYFNSSRPCQCNRACKTYRDCCNDYDDFCLKGFCVGRCDQPYDSRPRCQCNTACKQYNNCCDDYNAFCLIVNELGTTNYISSETTFITSVNELGTTNYISSETTFITSDLQDELTSGSITSLSKNTVNSSIRSEESSSGMIFGVTVSLTVVMLIVVLMIAFVYRKIHLREQLLSRPVGNGNRMSKINYHATEDAQEGQYQDIDISNGDYCLAAAVSDDTVNRDRDEDGEATYVRAISGVYDKLNEKDNRKNQTKNQNESASELEGFKIEIYSLTSKPTVNQQKQDNSTKDFDKWITTHAVDTDPTYDHSNNIIHRENLSNYDHFSTQK